MHEEYAYTWTPLNWQKEYYKCFEISLLLFIFKVKNIIEKVEEVKEKVFF